jgi:hypothetical protein
MRIKTVNIFYDGTQEVDVWCKSSETKPTEGISAGVLCETDTGNVYFFDEESAEWVEQFSFQDDGGASASTQSLSTTMLGRPNLSTLDLDSSDLETKEADRPSLEPAVLDSSELTRDAQEWTDKLREDAAGGLTLDPIETDLAELTVEADKEEEKE